MSLNHRYFNLSFYKKLWIPNVSIWVFQEITASRKTVHVSKHVQKKCNRRNAIKEMQDHLKKKILGRFSTEQREKCSIREHNTEGWYCLEFTTCDIIHNMWRYALQRGRCFLKSSKKLPWISPPPPLEVVKGFFMFIVSPQRWDFDSILCYRPLLQHMEVKI